MPSFYKQAETEETRPYKKTRQKKTKLYSRISKEVKSYSYSMNTYTVCPKLKDSRIDFLSAEKTVMDSF